MTPQELKNSILQLAIQGKLVDQRPEEGTAAELLRDILTQRRRDTECAEVGRDHRARRNASATAPRPPIPDDEKTFDIPESWEWVRLGECSTYADKKEKVLPSEIRPDDWSLDLEDIEKDTGRIVEFRSAGDRRITGDKVVFRKGQILYSKLRPYLKKILVAPKDGICTPELVPFFASSGIDVNYLVVVLKSPHVDFVINSVTYGVKMPRVGTDTMVNLPIPLPPLAEQKRIVAKIEELLPLIDRYEKAWSKLEDFSKRFPVDMQKSLLQMAIQGKLVEQRPEEGTAAESLAKIFAAKNAKDAKKGYRATSAKSAKESRLASNVSRPVEDALFDIPESWEWVRLGEVFNIVNGFTPLKSNSEFWVNGEIPWFTINDVHRQGRFITTTEKCITKKALSKNSERVVPSNTVLLCCTASIGEYAFAKIPLTTNQQFNALVVKEPYRSLIDPLFVLEFVKTLKGKLIELAGKTTFNFVSVGKVSNILFPLPPLAEQKRIVAKLEELLPLCERLR